MTRISRTYQIMVCEAHLLGKIKKCMKLLDKSGTYFYIKHYKNCVAPHYHIYYLSKNMTSAEKVRELFERFVATRLFINDMNLDRDDFMEYLLGNGEYKRKDIVSTMSLR